MESVQQTCRMSICFVHADVAFLFHLHAAYSTHSVAISIWICLYDVAASDFITRSIFRCKRLGKITGTKVFNNTAWLRALPFPCVCVCVWKMSIAIYPGAWCVLCFAPFRYHLHLLCCKSLARTFPRLSCKWEMSRKHQRERKYRKAVDINRVNTPNTDCSCSKPNGVVSSIQRTKAVINWQAQETL